MINILLAVLLFTFLVILSYVLALGIVSFMTGVPFMKLIREVLTK